MAGRGRMADSGRVAGRGRVAAPLLGANLVGKNEQRLGG
jgi:hypothetical protein